jgi:hypothetical protein
MAQTNIKIFNASLNNALSDNEYENSEDRRNGVLGQLARSNVHNKLFAQCSSVAKAVADFIVAGGYDAFDRDPSGMALHLRQAITDIVNLNIANRVPNVRIPNTAYQLYDVVHDVNLPLWAELECIQAGTTSGGDLAGVTVDSIGKQIADGTCVWAARAKRFHPLLNVPVPFSGSWTVPVLIGEAPYPIHPEIGLPMVDCRFCDGTNGTVDMRGRMLRGKQAHGGADAFGGSDTTRITKNKLPTDLFTCNSTPVNVRATSTTGGESQNHTHGQTGAMVNVLGVASGGVSVQAIAGDNPLSTGGASNGHTHSVSISADTSVAPSFRLNTSQSVLDTVPKHYALAYIQRIY